MGVRSFVSIGSPTSRSLVASTSHCVLWLIAILNQTTNNYQKAQVLQLWFSKIELLSYVLFLTSWINRVLWRLLLAVMSRSKGNVLLDPFSELLLEKFQCRQLLWLFFIGKLSCCSAFILTSIFLFVFLHACGKISTSKSWTSIRPMWSLCSFSYITLLRP